MLLWLPVQVVIVGMNLQKTQPNQLTPKKWWRARKRESRRDGVKAYVTAARSDLDLLGIGFRWLPWEQTWREKKRCHNHRKLCKLLSRSTQFNIPLEPDPIYDILNQQGLWSWIQQNYHLHCTISPSYSELFYTLTSHSVVDGEPPPTSDPAAPSLPDKVSNGKKA